MTQVRVNPTESLFLGNKTMKFKTATGTNTVKPVKHKWAKVIATVEKHAAKKTLRHMHKIELKKFELDELFA